MGQTHQQNCWPQKRREVLICFYDDSLYGTLGVAQPFAIGSPDAVSDNTISGDCHDNYGELAQLFPLNASDISMLSTSINFDWQKTTTSTVTTTTSTATTTTTPCQDERFYFKIHPESSDGLCTNAVDSTDLGCNTEQTGTGSEPCTMQSCCSIYQSSGDCQIFDKCAVVPTIVYHKDYPLFQPTGDVNEPATFRCDVLANDVIKNGSPGDFLVIDKVEGAFQYPLPRPVIDEMGNCVNCVDAGTCIAAKKDSHDLYNKVIQYTSPARFADKFECRYTALIKRPLNVNGTEVIVTVSRVHQTMTGHRSYNDRQLMSQPTPDPTYGGVMIGKVFNAPTDSPTTSPTKGPSTRYLMVF